MSGCKGCLFSAGKVAILTILVVGMFLVGATSLWHQSSPSLGSGLILVGGAILLLLMEGLLAFRFWTTGKRLPALILGLFGLFSLCGLCSVLSGANTGVAETVESILTWIVAQWPNPYR